MIFSGSRTQRICPSWISTTYAPGNCTIALCPSGAAYGPHNTVAPLALALCNVSATLGTAIPADSRPNGYGS